MDAEQLITVVSVRGVKPASAPTNLIYIGRRCAGWRQSPFANPFKLTPDDTREDVIDKYRHYLAQRIKDDDSAIPIALARLADMVRRGEAVQLGCWCSPSACHGDVVKEAVIWWIAKKEVTA